jgi:hypothetical protein
MSKELPYFRFTASEWLTDNISFEAYELKGLFIDVCAFYWSRDCSVNIELLNKRFSNASLLLEQLFSNGILKENKKNFVEIIFLNSQYDLLSEKRKKRQKSGKLGGLSKASNATAMLQQKPSYKDKDKDKDKDNIKKGKNRFTPPTQGDIESYCYEKNLNVEAGRFLDFYEANGWMVGKNKMKDWKATIRNWHRREAENKTKGSNHGAKSFVQQQDDAFGEILNSVGLGKNGVNDQGSASDVFRLQ